MVFDFPYRTRSTSDKDLLLLSDRCRSLPFIFLDKLRKYVRAAASGPQKTFVKPDPEAWLRTTNG
ncbi:hypothetical protein BG53_00460 [Paenibacillus darwinianus]|uniref:Uncharacterized protein n=1 Tax=Paenibacillus darwinianus TaxID=1380763 RepID=A0A9W5S1S3_9BACL|nr:hypothetical protein BG53_00460 [Paenibacillus darwinianus]EXX89521.1 hypothetical protein BG52_15425 [Paenibacillus darwinianus]EXX89712.1 hypothetical protein CH50_01025 [Paenibacillus darwinianus]